MENSSRVRLNRCPNMLIWSALDVSLNHSGAHNTKLIQSAMFAKIVCFYCIAFKPAGELRPALPG